MHARTSFVGTVSAMRSFVPCSSTSCHRFCRQFPGDWLREKQRLPAFRQYLKDQLVSAQPAKKSHAHDVNSPPTMTSHPEPGHDDLKMPHTATQDTTESTTTVSPAVSLGEDRVVSSKPAVAEDAASSPRPGWSRALAIPECGNLEGKKLNWAIGFMASTGFLMFGYDQGVLSGLLTLEEFQTSIPLMAPYNEANAWCQQPGQCVGTENIQAAAVGIYQVASFLGAIAVLIWGDGWGRRSSTFWGTLVVIFGTVFQVSSSGSTSASYAVFIVGRVVGGIGNGIVTASIPTWQSECAKPHMRGLLIMLAGALISGGIAISYLMNLVFFYASGTARWRAPLAIQAVASIIVMVGILFLPESPRWCLMKGQRTKCRNILARLAGAQPHSAEVNSEMSVLEESMAAEQAGGPFKIRELLDNGHKRNLHRTILAIVSQAFQQLTGINLTTYYLALLFEQSLGLDPELSRILSLANGVWYFACAMVALPLVERAGRRKLLLIGATGMACSFLVLGGLVSTGTVVDGVPILSTGIGAGAVVMMFLYVGFFGVSYLGLTWLLPAELTSLRIRIQANGFSTASNWIFNFMVVMVTPVGIASIGFGMYILFGILCALQIPVVYFFFPETKGRSLEELDVVFAAAYEERVSAVKKSLTMPKLTGSELDQEVARYFGSAAAQRATAEKQDVGSVRA